MNDAKKATNAGIIAVGFVAGFCFLASIIILLDARFLMPGLVASIATGLFFITLVMLLMAGRKFGNDERDIASGILKRANVIGFFAISLALVTLILLLANYSFFAAIVFLLVIFISFSLLWMFGKRNFKYW